MFTNRFHINLIPTNNFTNNKINSNCFKHSRENLLNENFCDDIRCCASEIKNVDYENFINHDEKFQSFNDYFQSKSMDRESYTIAYFMLKTINQYFPTKRLIDEINSKFLTKTLEFKCSKDLNCCDFDKEIFNIENYSNKTLEDIKKELQNVYDTFYNLGLTSYRPLINFLGKKYYKSEFCRVQFFIFERWYYGSLIFIQLATDYIECMNKNTKYSFANVILYFEYLIQSIKKFMCHIDCYMEYSDKMHLINIAIGTFFDCYIPDQFNRSYRLVRVIQRHHSQKEDDENKKFYEKLISYLKENNMFENINDQDDSSRKKSYKAMMLSNYGVQDAKKFLKTNNAMFDSFINNGQKMVIINFSKYNKKYKTITKAINFKKLYLCDDCKNENESNNINTSENELDRLKNVIFKLHSESEYESDTTNEDESNITNEDKLNNKNDNKLNNTNDDCKNGGESSNKNTSTINNTESILNLFDNFKMNQDFSKNEYESISTSEDESNSTSKDESNLNEYINAFRKCQNDYRYQNTYSKNKNRSNNKTTNKNDNNSEGDLIHF